ncbi:hypothetical protein SB861_61745, partial [Paraburkholderia sp. SIMBA_049]
RGNVAAATTASQRAKHTGKITGSRFKSQSSGEFLLSFTPALQPARIPPFTNTYGTLRRTGQPSKKGVRHSTCVAQVKRREYVRRNRLDP